MICKVKYVEPPYNVLKKKIPVHYTGIERYKSKKDYLLHEFKWHLFWYSLKLKAWILNRNVYKALGMLPVPKPPNPRGRLSRL